HGEMLGEDRQWGHAYYLFPPVLQIPLVVHLPPAVARSAAVDVDAIAFSTDITPTMYTVLGYWPSPQTDLMGQSLIGASGADFTSGCWGVRGRLFGPSAGHRSGCGQVRCRLGSPAS